MQKSIIVAAAMAFASPSLASQMRPAGPVIKVEGSFVRDTECPSDAIYHVGSAIRLHWDQMTSDAIAAVCISKVANELGPDRIPEWLSGTGFKVNPHIKVNSDRDGLYSVINFENGRHPYRDSLRFYSVRYLITTSLIVQMRWEKRRLKYLSLDYGHWLNK